MSIIAFAIVAAVTIFFVTATIVGELVGAWQFRLPKLTQTGDSSLSPRSVNWLAGIAFAAALYVIYLVDV